MTARRAVAPGRGSVVAVAMTVVVVGLMLLLIMFAARTGPQRIWRGTLRDPSIPPATPRFTPPTPPSAPRGHGQDALPHGGVLVHAIGLTIRVAVVAAIAYAAFRLLMLLVAAVRRRPPRRPAPDHVDFDVLEDPEPVLDEMRDDAYEQLHVLLAGEPRNAIVACWDRFEEQAERAGFARKPWQTSSEFTIQLLDAVQADGAAVTRLEGLYREARFSSHEIDETRRDAAREALEAIHASLGFQAVRR